MCEASVRVYFASDDHITKLPTVRGVKLRLTNVRLMFSVRAVPALANARPDCDPFGGPLKVITQSKKRTNFVVR
jgi:hypothetical protein